MKNKAKQLKKKIESLPKEIKEDVQKYYNERPERIYGVQQSLLKGFSDLPLFASDAEQKQQNLF